MFGLNYESQIYQDYLTIIYQAETSALLSHADGQKTITETNGEVLFPSVAKLLSLLSLKDEDKFLDLGSGRGRLVAQVFLTSPVSQAIGIEVVLSLHQQAEAVANRICQDVSRFDGRGRQITFILGDFFECDFPDASVVFINSTCFSQSMLYRLSVRLDQHIKVHSILTLKPLPALKRFQFKKAIRVECSWDSALCFLYCR